MKLGLDEYAELNSPMHHWEQRSKVVAIVALMFAFAFVSDLILLPVMLLVTAVLYALSRLPLSFLLTRLRYPGLFILAVIVLILFASAGNTVLAQVGPLSITREGVETVALIAARFFCIITVSLILFGTAPFLTSIKAMRSLRLPDVMVDMSLLSYRYLEEFGKTRRSMQHAMQLRGFESDRFSFHTLRVLSGLVGSLLIRSYDRSERVNHAMRMRGYGQSRLSHLHRQEDFASDISEANRTSRILFWSTLGVATALVAASIFL
ncbi:MAG: cobalt ECF transporter T component CbiQ [Elainellaceae cyanobacterium]